MNRAEERELIRRAVAGDRDAAAACIRAHQGPLYTYILRMSGRPDLAEDVVQEAFLRVLNNFDRYDPTYRFSTWLFTIARRVYLNTTAKKSARPDTDSLDARPADTDTDCVARAESRQIAHDAIQRALLELPQTQREIVILFHQLDWPIALIARHLDIPEGTVKSHLHRGRNRLRILLADLRAQDDNQPMDNEP